MRSALIVKMGANASITVFERMNSSGLSPTASSINVTLQGKKEKYLSTFTAKTLNLGKVSGGLREFGRVGNGSGGLVWDGGDATKVLREASSLQRFLLGAWLNAPCGGRAEVEAFSNRSRPARAAVWCQSAVGESAAAEPKLWVADILWHRQKMLATAAAHKSLFAFRGIEDMLTGIGNV